MNDEDFKQTVLDYFDIEQRRHQDIMAQASDILAKITAVSASLDAMKTKFETAMADMSSVLPGGHSAVMDTLVAPLEAVMTKADALGTEMEAKIKALPVPGVTPAA